jgi:hypothetical protein
VLNSSQGGADHNRCSRKEVSYVCKTANKLALIVANVFRRAKEGRELGEAHGQAELA